MADPRSASIPFRAAEKACDHHVAIGSSVAILALFATLQWGLIGPVLLLLLPVAAIVGGMVLLKEQWVLWIAVGYAMTLGLFVMALPSVPVGIAMDAVIATGFGGMVLRAMKTGCYEAFRVPLGGMLLVWMGYNFMQVINPEASSRMAWLYTMRPAIFYPMLFFITAHVVQSRKDLSRFLKLIMVGLSLPLGWGLIQAANGYFPFEMSYLARADAIHLVFIQGRWRIFGTLLSPAQFGVAMGFLASIALILAFGKFSLTKRIGLLLLAIMALSAMVLSGTRAAFIILPIALMVWVIASRNLKAWIAAGVVGVLFIGVLVTPSHNYHIQRIQSVFEFSEDESFNVRMENRQMIYPWIAKHPLGGGLGSTGVWGMRFSPGTFLANFAPDSGLIRVAVELGWIGLLIYLMLWARLLWCGWRSYFSLSDPMLKQVLLALLCTLPAILVVEWAQDIIGKAPFNLLFWMLAALVVIAPKIDPSSPNHLDSKKT